MIPGASRPSPHTVSWGVDTGGLTKAHVRRSIKLTSKSSFSVGEDQWLRSMLAVIDVAHVPTGCATWPAFWMANEAAWPKHGEIDIIETTNLDAEVTTTLHTCGPASAHDSKSKKNCAGATKCTMEAESKDLFTGTWAPGNSAAEAFNCDIDAPGQYGNQGCSILGEQGTAGKALNDGGGGMFATEWSMKDLSDDNASKGDLDPLDVPHIAMWFFPRKDLPLTDEMWGAQPDTKAWVAAGHKPYAYFRLGKDNCDPTHFSGQRLIFDTTLCGDNAGNKWGSSGCAQAPCGGQAPSPSCMSQCDAFVRDNGTAFTDAYWEVYNVSVWGVKTGIPRPQPPAKSAVVEMEKYVIIAGVVLGICILSICGLKCWVDSREASYDRLGRRAEINARLRDTSGWEYSHEKQASGRSSKSCHWRWQTQSILSVALAMLIRAGVWTAQAGGGNAGGEAAKAGSDGPAETAW
jgi:hypothetical protein